MEVGPGSGAGAGPGPRPGCGAGPGPGLKWWPPSAGATKVHAGRKPIIMCRKGGLTNITSHIQAQICIHGEGSSVFSLISLRFCCLLTELHNTESVLPL